MQVQVRLQCDLEEWVFIFQGGDNGQQKEVGVPLLKNRYGHFPLKQRRMYVQSLRNLDQKKNQWYSINVISCISTEKINGKPCDVRVPPYDEPITWLVSPLYLVLHATHGTRHHCNTLPFSTAQVFLYSKNKRDIRESLCYSLGSWRLRHEKIDSRWDQCTVPGVFPTALILNQELTAIARYKQENVSIKKTKLQRILFFSLE